MGGKLFSTRKKGQESPGNLPIHILPCPYIQRTTQLNVPQAQSTLLAILYSTFLSFICPSHATCCILLLCAIALLDSSRTYLEGFLTRLLTSLPIIKAQRLCFYEFCISLTRKGNIDKKIILIFLFIRILAFGR